MQDKFENIFDCCQDRPIVIWGTKAASMICYKVVSKLGRTIAAVGDNDIRVQGEKWHGFLVLPAYQIRQLYPDALIVVGSFFRSVSDRIVEQLGRISDRFLFCRFEQIEFLYETGYLNRAIEDRDKFYQIIHYIGQNERYPWKRNLNKRVLPEYRYAVRDTEASDLKEFLADVYGVKNLLLTVTRGMISAISVLVDALFRYENIGHIVVVIDIGDTFDVNQIGGLADKVFYVICDETVKETSIQELEKRGFTVHTRKILPEVFQNKAADHSVSLTERDVVQNIMDYTGIGHAKVRLPCGDGSVCFVQLFNGLANQILMYLFGRYLEQQSGKHVIFDDTILCLDILYAEENVRRIVSWMQCMDEEKVVRGVNDTRERSGFYKFKRAEVAEVLDAPIRLLSDYFDERTWMKYLMKIKKDFSHKYAQSFPLGQVLTERGIGVTVIRDNIMPDDFFAIDHFYGVDAYTLDMPYEKNSMTDLLFHMKQNAYYMGIWATGKVMDCYMGNRGWVRKQVSFRLNPSRKNKAYIKDIRENTSVMIHIRRGDFVHLGLFDNAQYYRQAIQGAEAMSGYENKRYFIFSDDLEWCKKNKDILGISQVEDRAVFMDENTGKNSYMDLYLMSLGKILIPTPGSSFSYVAMLISESVVKYIDVPRYLYETEHGLSGVPVYITFG